MDLFVIRNRQMLADVIEKLSERRLPFKIAAQDISVIRSLQANDYLWGVVYQIIAEVTGQDPESVHQAYKILFNFKWNFKINPDTKKYEIDYGPGTTVMPSYEFWTYIMKVRADAELDRIIIPMPNECFDYELKFAS